MFFSKLPFAFNTQTSKKYRQKQITVIQLEIEPYDDSYSSFVFALFSLFTVVRYLGSEFDV
jgi:hypothetical protein